jgi:ABC-2 type transport system permease protein
MVLVMSLSIPVSQSLFGKFGDDLRDGRDIAVMEIRRSVRGYFRQPRRKYGLAALLLIFGSMLLLGGVPTAYSLGQTVRIEQRFPFLTTVRQLLPLLIAGVIFLFVSRTIEQIAHIDSEDLMLTTTTPRAVVIGILSAEMMLYLVWFGLPVLLLCGAFAVGAGTIAPVVTVPLALAPILLFSGIAGYIIGIAGLYISHYLPIPSQIKTIVYVLLFLLIFIGSQVLVRQAFSNGLPPWLASIGHALLVSPFAAYVDFFLIGTPVASPISLSAVLVLVGLIVSVPIGFTVASRLATRFWLTETAHRRDLIGGDSEAGTKPTKVARPFAWSRSGRIAWHYLRSGARSPQQFAHLMVIFPAAAPLISSLFTQHSVIYVFVLGGSIILGAILAGAAFGLNPFGDEQTTLPLLLVTTTPPEQFVRGRIIAGLVVSVPFVVVIPFLITIVGPPSVLDVFVYVLIGLGLSVTSAAWALGIGTAYPTYESREMWGTDSVMPSTLAMLAHEFAVAIGGLISLVLSGLALSQNSSLLSLYIGGVAVCLVIFAVSGGGAYVYAVRRYHTHTLD